ncbi:MAG: hypothetical protein JSR33_06985, partial [Proteobacteria bacterium]|nr:hypothetical protein [Pseudomonadota bacterium]
TVTPLIQTPASTVTPPQAPVVAPTATPAPVTNNSVAPEKPKVENAAPSSGQQDRPDANQVASVNLPPPSDTEDEY